MNNTLLKSIDPRPLFYLVGPRESSFADVADVPDYVEQATLFFIAFVFLEYFILRIQKRSHLVHFNDGITSVSAGLIMRCFLIVTQSLEVSAYVWFYDRFHLISVPWDSAWTWWFCFLGVDFGYYWFHRLAHEVNFLWAAHQVHHSSEYYNATTALRQSAVQTWSSWIIYLPLALIVPPPIFLAHIQFNLLYQFWIHTEVIRTLGPLEWVMNTASHHRVHHGRNRYCIDKNYAGTLIIWDRMFGTFEPESEEVVYGLTHPVESFNPIYLQVCHFQYIWGLLVQSKSWSERFAILFKGPGWGEGKPRLGLIEDIPDVHAPQKRYDPKISSFLSGFMLVHLLVIVACFQEIYVRRLQFNCFVVAGFISYVLLHLTAIGSTLDKKKYSAPLHLVTSAIFIVGHYLVGSMHFENDSNVLHLYYALRVYGFCVCLYWLYRSLSPDTASTDKKRRKAK